MRKTILLSFLTLSALLLCLLTPPTASTRNAARVAPAAKVAAPHSREHASVKSLFEKPRDTVSLKEEAVASPQVPLYDLLGLAAPPVAGSLSACNPNNNCYVGFDDLFENVDTRDLYTQVKFSYDAFPGTSVPVKTDTCGLLFQNSCTQARSKPNSISLLRSDFRVFFPHPVTGLFFYIASIETEGVIAQVLAYNGTTQVASITVTGNRVHDFYPVDLRAARVTEVKVVGIQDNAGFSYDDFTFNLVMPGATTGLKATVSGQTASLSWNTASDASFYRVKRATSPNGPYTQIGTPQGTSFSDPNLTPGLTYYYTVTAANVAGDGAASNTVQVTTRPLAPQNPKVSPQAGFMTEEFGMRVQWDLSQGAESYNIKRAEAVGGPYTTIAPNVKILEFVDNAIDVETDYYYVVSAVNSAGESANSAPVHAFMASPCGSGVGDIPVRKVYDAGNGWIMDAEVSPRDGLVLRSVTLNGRLMANMLSVPYFTVRLNRGGTITEQRGELTPRSTNKLVRTQLVAFQNLTISSGSQPGDFLIMAMYKVDRLAPNSKSCLYIFQTYWFSARHPGEACEPSATLSCQRYYPQTGYKFVGREREKLESISFPQRLHFQIDGFRPLTVGLFRDCDFIPLPGMGCGLLKDPRFVREDNPLLKEIDENVVLRSHDRGTMDNVHITWDPTGISKPPVILTRPIASLGGCPECAHMHWRWGTLSALAAEKAGQGDFGGGGLIGFNNTDRDLNIAVTRYKNVTAEIHPDNYKALVNNEYIMHSSDKLPIALPDEVVLWYVMTMRGDEDLTFGHGAWFSPDKPLLHRLLQRFIKPNGSTNSAQSTSTSTSADGPTEVVYGHLYEDGPSYFSEIDPSAVGPLPQGYTPLNNTAYEVFTDANVSGPHVVYFSVPSVTDQTTFNNLRVFHGEPDPFDPDRAIWVDRTILAPDPDAPDFAAHVIKARADNVGQFVIGQLTGPLSTASADVAVTLSASADQVTSGGNLVYNISLQNKGPNKATGVGLSSTLALETSFVSASGQGTCQFKEAKVYCKAGDMLPGATANFSVTVKVNDNNGSIPAGGKTIGNLVVAGAQEADPDRTNNSATKDVLALPETNAAPVVNITSPASESTFVGPVNISVTATATDGDGSVSQVAFYDNGEFVGNAVSVGSNLYRFDLNNVAFGSHFLQAAATDNGGRTSISEQVRLEVNGQATVAITSPAPNEVRSNGSDILLSARVNPPPGGFVSKVEFFANSRLVGAASPIGNQYNFTWSGAARGRYLLKAIVTDNNGVTSSSSFVTLTVTNRPTVTLVSPVDGTNYASSPTIEVAADVGNFEGIVDHVDFYVNGQVLGRGALTAPNHYVFNWTDISDGIYSIAAVAVDDLGTATSSPLASVAINTTGLVPGDLIWFDDTLPPNAKPSSFRDDWYWAQSNPVPIQGAKSHQSIIADGLHKHGFEGTSFKLPVNAGDKLYTYVFLHPGYRPQEIMLEWKDSSGWDHRAFWSAQNVSLIHARTGGDESSHWMGPLPADSRWVRLEVPAEAVGLAGKLVDGMYFDLYGGRAAWDRAGKSSQAQPQPPTPGDTVWFEEDVPTGAVRNVDRDKWTWVNPPVPFSGLAHVTFQAPANDDDAATLYRAHYFNNATQSMTVAPGEILFTYAYLDPVNTPDQIVVGWSDSTNSYFAYWGESHRLFGKIGTETMRYMGPVPISGTWVRLEVPASYVGLEGKTVRGMYFGMNRQARRGLVYWDKAGKSSSPLSTTIEPLHITAPVYRYSNEMGYSYFGNAFQFNGLQGGPRWYAHSSQAPGTVPFYRYRFQNAPRQYFYTVISPNSQGRLPTDTGWLLDTEFNNDGIAFYIYPKDKPAPPGTVPLLRYGNNAGSYFYTIYKEEAPPPNMVFQEEAGYVSPSLPVFSTVENPIDNTVFFVKQQYRDFLGREADVSGLNYWVGEITQCNDPARRGANETESVCIERKRVDVSGAFFLSIEFKETGYLVYRLYNAALNRSNGLLSFNEFLADTAKIGDGVIVGEEGWQQKIESNKVNFISEFVGRDEFLSLYPESLTSGQFVDALYAHANISLSPEERQAAVAEFAGATDSSERRARAIVLRKLAEGSALNTREINRAFVLMQYFGYLRRNPSDPPDKDLTGYNFWLDKLNAFGGDFRAAEMVKAFITATEYRARFGQPTTASASSKITAGTASAKAGVVSLTFSSAGSDSALNVKSVYPAYLSLPPTGYVFYDNLAWDVSTTSSVGGPITIKVSLDGTFNDPAEFAGLRLLHLEGGSWVDRTILPSDFNTRSISASVSSLAPVALARLTGDRPPSVSITSPTTGQSYTAPATVMINASASSASASITKVEFLQGDTLLGEDTTAPYSFNWINVPGGSYALTCRATDSKGVISSSPVVNISVNDLPAVYIASPAQNAVLDYPANVTINAYANDSNGIKQVEFFQGTTSLGIDTTTPYSVNWSSAPVGTYTLKAVATDNKNAAMTSPAVNVTVRNPPPKLLNVSPWTVEVGSGAFTITINGSGFVPGAVVSFNGQSRTTTFVNSTRVTAQILASDVQTAGLFPVTVINPAPGGAASNAYSFPVNVPPSVSLTSPTNGQVFNAPARITLSASVTDDADGANVAYYNGNTFIVSTGAAPSYRFDWTNVAAGQYTIKAVVTDRHGSVRNSTPVTITVNDPTLVLTDDFNDNRLDGTKWRYSNADSQSFVLEQNQRLEIPLRPNATGYYGIQTLGTHDLREKTVSVDLVQPTSQGGWVETYYQIKRDEANYYHMSVGAGSFVCDAWTAGVRDRTVLPYDASVGRFWRFRHDVASNTMNFETSADGSNWTTHKTVAVGFPLDSMYAVMLAGAWGTGNSAPGAAVFDNFTIRSTALNRPPVIALTKPSHNATFGLGAPINLAANASDSDGSIQRVEFYEGPNKLGEDTTQPYTFQWNNAKPGNYFITAKAVDSAGSVVTSNGAYIAVSNSAIVEALLVVADAANMPASDAVIKARLENLGFTVTVKDAVSAASSDAANKKLVFVSETVASANVNTKFRDVAVPVISAEPQIFDDMLMTGPTLNTDYGYAGGQTQVGILVPSHPLAAGCTGTVTISTLASGAAWGRPAASAAQVGSLAGDSTAKAIFAYESGAMMVGMQAPARRVGLIHGNEAFTSLTENGAVLFDAAVRWATTTPPFVQYPYNNTPAAIPGTVQVELYDEGGDGTAYHDLTPGNDASNNYRYPTDVDAWDGGIGYVQAGEWLKYTVNVGATGIYKADVRLAAGTSGGSFHIELDGVDKTGPMYAPNTGGWGTYQTVSKDNISLDAGRHVMRIVMDAGGSNGFVANFDSVSFAASTGASDLVAYWKLDEGSGTAASDSAGTNTGTLQGPIWLAGRAGPGALSFDGVDDRVSINATPSLTAVANNFTLSFWAYPRSPHEIDAEGYTWGGVSGQRYAFEPKHGSGSDAGAGISVGTNGVSIYEHADNYMPAQLVYQAPLTGWTHVTLVYENKQPRLYINGALVRAGLVSQRANVILHPQDIGGMSYGYYDGLLDDIRVYNRVLNAAEVSSLATATGSSAAAEFSVAQNPNGVWSYGYRASAGAPFKLYPNHDATAGNVGTWYDASIAMDQWNLPVVSHGPSNPLVQMHPGPRGEQTVLRWTAPAAAVVNVSGRFENMNNATTDVHVVHNSTNSLFDGAINGQGSVAPFSIRKTVAAGDTLDFAVGWGSNGNYNYDSTGLALNITTEPLRNQSAFVSQSVPATVEAGSKGSVSVTMRNIGTTTWSSAGNYNLGSQSPQDNVTWGSARVALPGPVLPGGQVTFNFYATAPTTPGTYAFQSRMVQDNVEWFGEYSAAVNVVAGQPLGTPPTADWSFDEGSGPTAADMTGNGNTGTLQNGAAWAVGRNGASLAFDGIDDYVQVGAQPQLTVSNGLTISTWLYPTGTSSAGLGVILNKEGEYEIARFNDGTIQWAVANSVPGWNFINTGFVAPLNQWTHIALTYDRGTVKTYANGQLVHTYSGSGAIGDVATSQNDLRIGGRQCCAQFFQGRLDEVRVYNQTLDAAAVKQLWQGLAPRNLALGKTATQSSDNSGGVASRAVDGNTDGNWTNGSVTHTYADNQAWWQVDLGAVQSIAGVKIWNRTDCCSDRISNFYVLVSDVPFTSSDLTTTLSQQGVSAYLVSGQPWTPTTIMTNRTGRYVRVQLKGVNYLSLAEVQVMGTPAMVAPGIVQAENFNNGPEGVAYHDTDAGNNGGAYRQTDVDLASGYGTGYCVGWTNAGEWLDYSINVLQAGAYNLETSVAMPGDTARFHVEIDGVDVTGSMAVPNTGGWNTWQTVVKPGIQLTAGRHTMRLVMETTYAGNFDYFRLVAQGP
jgi:uncharacterized repeat protein (TIGR01451 family)